MQQNLNEDCTAASYFPELVLVLYFTHHNLDITLFCSNSSELDNLQCIFPQYSLKYITTPFFVLNSAYDVFQVRKKVLVKVISNKFVRIISNLK